MIYTDSESNLQTTLSSTGCAGCILSLMHTELRDHIHV
jgi:hypothetical protein